MAATNLDINLTETYSINYIGFVDLSTYSGTPSGVTMEITPPGWSKAIPTFVPNNVNLYSAANLNVDCDANSPLPDGQYDIRYSITPNSTIYVEKSFFRTSLIRCKYERTRLAIDASCSHNTTFEKSLQDARFLIEGAIASGNQCDFDAAYKKYTLADKILNRLTKCEC